MSLRSFFASCLLASIAFAPAAAFAQEEETFTLEGTPPDVISFVISPENPSPKQSVTVTARSFTIDLASASLRWVLDGKTVLTGVGETSYTFIAKDSGVASTVSVTATPAQGSVSSASTKVTPTSTDILWQAVDASVPPLYRGKALPTNESKLRFVAMTDIKSKGVRVPSGSLMYTWQHNGTLMKNASGYGKNSFTVAGSYLDSSNTASVAIQTRDTTVKTAGSVRANPVKPFVLWYAADQISGPRFEKTLTDGYTIGKGDISLIAAPYFFSPGNPTSSKLLYAWTVNGQKIETPSTPNTLFLRRESDQSGEAVIKLSLSNVATLFQEASAKLSLQLQ